MRSYIFLREMVMVTQGYQHHLQISIIRIIDVFKECVQINHFLYNRVKNCWYSNVFFLWEKRALVTCTTHISNLISDSWPNFWPIRTYHSVLKNERHNTAFLKSKLKTFDVIFYTIFSMKSRKGWSSVFAVSFAAFRLITLFLFGALVGPSPTRNGF